MGVVESL